VLLFNSEMVLTVGKLLVVGVFAMLMLVAAPPASAQSDCTWCSSPAACDPSVFGTTGECSTSVHCFPDPGGSGDLECISLCSNPGDPCEPEVTMMSMSGSFVATESHQLARLTVDPIDGELRERCSGAIVRVAGFLDRPAPPSSGSMVVMLD
jgi:hypothetical protein